MAITREDIIEQSVQDYVREQIFDVRGYPQDQIEMLDSFPHNRFEGPLDKNYLAIGFNFDDDGSQGELGSDLMVRNYTIEFFVFGRTPVWGRNLANAVKFSLEQDGRIPLYDISQLNKPLIDHVVVVGVRAERQVVPNPKPFEENIWVTSLIAEDTYFARLV